MGIGRQDVVIPTTLERAVALSIAAGLVARRWPQFVVVDGGSGRAFEQLRDVPFGRVNELLLFRDEQARKSWEELGADPTNANSLIHLLSAHSKLTVVVDDARGEDVSPVLSAIRESLAFNAFYGSAA
jgi:hypothetical protein